jgi:deoxyribose-phosphate aldolase
MNLNEYIDHTILKPEATAEQVKKACAEAKEHRFAAVCVNAHRIALVAKELKGTNVKVCGVVGFPLGATLPEVKAFETKAAIEKGAQEVDMVINVGALKDKDYDTVLADIKGVVDAAKGKAIVKVIFENCLLTDDEKLKACELCVKAGAHFVKTSTGFNSGGATLHDVELMKKAVAGKAKVKAAGGVRDQETAKAMIAAGAERIGTSSGIAIIQGIKKEGTGY